MVFYELVQLYVYIVLYMYIMCNQHVQVKLFSFQADLAFKQEEKAKSEATAKTLDLGGLFN